MLEWNLRHIDQLRVNGHDFEEPSEAGKVLLLVVCIMELDARCLTSGVRLRLGQVGVSCFFRDLIEASKMSWLIAPLAVFWLEHQ